ncbi:MAG: hypothetical protein ABIQ04_04970 [Candidatus Saccharimonadales bacterium]
MLQSVNSQDKNAQIALGTGSAVIALGAVMISVGEGSGGWIIGVIMMIAGAILVGMGLAVSNKNKKK